MSMRPNIIGTSFEGQMLHGAFTSECSLFFIYIFLDWTNLPTHMRIIISRDVGVVSFENTCLLWSHLVKVLLGWRCAVTMYLRPLLPLSVLCASISVSVFIIRHIYHYRTWVLTNKTCLQPKWIPDSAAVRITSSKRPQIGIWSRK